MARQGFLAASNKALTFDGSAPDQPDIRTIFRAKANLSKLVEEAAGDEDVITAKD